MVSVKNHQSLVIAVYRIDHSPTVERFEIKTTSNPRSIKQRWLSFMVIIPDVN